jgi:hypothetical protein
MMQDMYGPSHDSEAFSSANCFRRSAFKKNIAHADFSNSAKKSGCRFINENSGTGFGRMGTWTMGREERTGKDSGRKTDGAQEMQETRR